MGKDNNNKHLLKNVYVNKFEIPDLLKNTKAFKLLKNNHRSALYKKMDKYFRPNKTPSYYKQLFLYSEKLIPKNDNFIFYTATMEHCLIETINDVLTDLQVQKAQLDELIPELKSLIKCYETI